MKCRHCQSPLRLPLVDLGSAPPSNAYLSQEQLGRVESWFPLKVLVCETCWLVQTEEFPAHVQLFEENYAYFSGFSSTWLEHCQAYVAAMTERFQLGAHSLVVEIAANDGYLLQYVQARHIPCLGVEPTASTASAARAKGLEIVEEFFGAALAKRLLAEGKQADLMVANNVLAHVPAVNDFVAGFKVLLKPDGVVTFEFPTLLRLLAENQFDTIYHEHFSYLSFTSAEAILSQAGLETFDLDELPTHGGSLRLYVQHQGGPQPITPAVSEMRAREQAAGINSRQAYAGFQKRSEDVKNGFLEFLLQARRAGHKVGAYGAAAKGNTLLNFAGVRPDLVQFVVDRNPAKQGTYLPGSRIPVVDEDFLRQARPDFVVIFPWNLRQEVTAQLSYIRQWNARFVTAVPSLEVF